MRDLQRGFEVKDPQQVSLMETQDLLAISWPEKSIDCNQILIALVAGYDAISCSEQPGTVLQLYPPDSRQSSSRNL